MNEPLRDDTMADLLAAVPVPPATERFWTDLEARLAPLDPAHPREPLTVVATAAEWRPTSPAPAVPMVPLTGGHPPSRRLWRVLTVAAAAAVVGLVVVTRGPAVDRTADGGPLASATPEEVVAAYEQALRSGDEATARAMLGPRARAEVDRGLRLPRSDRPDLPNTRYAATVLSDQAAVVMILTGSIETDKETGVSQEFPDSPYLGAVVVWRGSPTEPWLVEGSRIGPEVNTRRRGSGGGLSGPANGFEVSMPIPEEGRSWIVVDGAVHATATWSGPAQWDVPAVPPTDTGIGREVVDVFIGPNVISAYAARFGMPPGS